MSVLVEAITVIVRNDDVDRHYPGGVTALAASAPNQTFRTDGQLTAIGFMAPSDVEVYILSLQKTGLRFVEDGHARDIVVVDQIHGPTTACDWIDAATELDGTKCVWLRGTPKGELAAHESWVRGTTLTLRTDISMSQLDLDPETGHRIFVGEGGVKQYLGEAFNEGRPDARMLRAHLTLIREAKRAAWNSLLSRGWLGLATSDNPDPEFHLGMRYKNQLGLVFVAARWSSTDLTPWDQKMRDRLVSRAKELRGIPILARCDLFAPIHIRSSDERPGSNGMTLLIKDGDLEVAAPTVKALTFENLATGLPLIEAKFDLRARIEISDWELLDFAIQQARAGLEQDGFEITGWTSEAGTGPHIVAVKDGATTRIVVGAARYPVVEPVLDRDRLMSVAEKTLIEGGQLATRRGTTETPDRGNAPRWPERSRLQHAERCRR